MAPPREEEDEWIWSYGLSGSLLSADGPFMDFIEHSLELLTCPDTPITQVLYPENDAVHLWGQKPMQITAERDYATMHDHFLEALLQEQTIKPRKRSESSSPPPVMACCSDSVTSQESTQPTSASKKRRALKLHRRHHFSPSRHKRQVHIDIRQQREEDDSSYAYKRLRLEDLTSIHPPPHSFVHANCRMQKDKGKGELPGIDVCAEGRNACLHKLREKMELLAQATLSNTSGNAEMKRRRARIVDVTSEHAETRSIIQLRMGFLSMQYGVLLRWDRTTHLITFVVLRKMCSESFYSKALPSSSSTVEPAPKPPQKPPPVTKPSTYELQNVVDGNHAILQLADGCEVALLEPPYFIDRPDTFTPSVLRVNVTNVNGLKPLSTWIVKITLQNVPQTLRLGWNNQVEPRKSGPAKLKLEWQLPPSSIDLQLEVIVSEQRRRENRRTLLHTTIPVPLSFLSPSSSRKTAKSKEVVIGMDDASSLTLEIHHQSDFAHWLQREVDARKGQEVVEGVRGYLCIPPCLSSVPQSESAIIDKSMSPFALCCAW